jgi:hypothetical protein
MLSGQMISSPFILFIVFTVYGSEGILTAISSLTGLTGLFTLLYLLRFNKTRKTILIESFILILLAVPIIERLTSVPIEMFNYPAFIFPVISFVVCYVLSLSFSWKEIKRKEAEIA